MEYFKNSKNVITDNGDEFVILKEDAYMGETILVPINEYEMEYGKCVICGKVFRIDDMYDNQESILREYDDYVCSECADDEYFFCDGHDRYEPVENEIVEVGNGYYCYDYAIDHFYRCEDCDEWLLPEDSYYSEYDDAYYCEYCYFENNHDGRGDSIITSYHGHNDYEKCSFMDRSDRARVPHIGMELEVHNSSGVEECDAESVYDSLGDYVVFEEDGSIDPGFEIITRPASLDYHLSRKEDWEKASKYLVENGYRSHDTSCCGLHTHIDRKYFGTSSYAQQLAESKFLFIFMKHWESLAKCSRRRDFYWCQKNPCHDIEDIVSASKDYDKKRYHFGHNVAVNIQNRETIELRIWKGTLNVDTIEATLRLANRLAWVVKYVSVIRLSQMTWEEIMGTDPVILEYWEKVKDRTI